MLSIRHLAFKISSSIPKFYKASHFYTNVILFWRSTISFSSLYTLKMTTQEKVYAIEFMESRSLLNKTSFSYPPCRKKVV